MAVAQLLLVVAVLLRCTSAIPACPESCTCLSPTQLNCSSSGLTSVPGHIPDSVAELNLSDNLLDAVTIDQRHSNLRNVRLGNNSITHLSLCTERNLGRRYVGGRRLHHLRLWRRRGCVSWAPSLQLLSAERNQLEQLPEGLQSCESLQVLQLSFNRISTLRPGDLDHLQQLKELHLKHNLITSLHPQTFKGLAQLQVLDLSFNMLTSLHPSMYLSLHNIGVDVRLAGNRWKCDCRMRSLRRWMAFDTSKGLHAWSVVCASPSSLSGQDLLHLEDDDLNCLTTDRPERYQDVTVFSGSKMLLSCSIQDSAGWAPSGEASAGQPEDGLLTKDIRERDSGIYVCISEEGEVVQMFNLQISKVQGAPRRARSLLGSSDQIFSQNRIGNERNQRATQCNLALAVCLSILFSFIVAFILGVLARPCIDNLLKKVCKKKSSTTTNTVSTVEQRQYDNEAYCDVDEHAMAGNHRERRVTFSTVDYREDRNVQYYDTVAGDQDSVNDDVFEGEAAAARRARTGDSESESSSQHSSEGNQRDGRGMTVITTNTEGRDSSSSSDSSDEEKQMRDQRRPRSPQLVDNSVQQTANIASSGEVVAPHISIETHEIPGFSSEPFEGWSPHSEHTDLADPDQWHENEEQFEFSDSARSPSPGSRNVLGPFNKKRDDTSSSSSHLSDDDVTHYTVNSDPEDNVTNTSFHQGVSLEQQIHAVDANRPSLGFIRPGVTKARPFSSTSSESDGAEQDKDKGVGRLESGVKIEPMPRTKRYAPLPPKAHSSSSSSESDTEDKTLQVEQKFGEAAMTKIQFQEPQTASIVLETQRPSLDLEQSTHIKRQGAIIAHSPDSKSSSSSSSESDGEGHRVKHEKDRGVGKVEAVVVNREMVQPMPRTKRNAPPPPKARSSSSSSDSDVGKKNLQVGRKLGETHMTKIQFQEPPTASIVLESQRPSLDLEHSKHIKMHEGIKVPSPDSNSSSSSDSEDETKLRPGKVVVISDLAVQKPQTESRVPDGQWPALDLGHIPKVKRRLDIKIKSQNSHSSSSSDSEEEAAGHNKKQVQKQTQTARVPTVLKSDTSSSSDSEDESVGYQVQPGKVVILDLAVQKPQTGSRVPDGQWPSLDLGHIPKVKRRLDIKRNSKHSKSSSSSDSDIKKQVQQQTETARVPKALESDTSSSSDSEDDSVVHQVKSGKVVITDLAVQKPQTGSRVPDRQWPSLDLLHIPKVKRRLDIKRKSRDSDLSSSSDSDIKKQVQQQTETARVPKALESDTSSSSDSEDESTVHQERPGKAIITDLAVQTPQKESNDPEARWPSLDLGHIPKVKRRLDIKAKIQDSDSSSSSDSDNESTSHIKKQQKDMAKVSVAVKQTVSHDQWTERPARAPSPASDSSSSSDSEDETKKQEQVHMGRISVTETQTLSTNPQTQWPLLDLQHTASVKRRLDFKARSAASTSSSSSDSEDESIHTEKPGKVFIPGLATDKPTTGSYNPDAKWPTLDLGHLPKVKRRLDIKAPSPDSSSSSDSEHESPNLIKKEVIKQTEGERVTITSHNLETKRPVKASSASSSSSSSNSEEDIPGHRDRPGKVVSPALAINLQTGIHVPDSRWPTLDLEHTPKIKRRLDIKAPSPASDSSSSSDSEAEIAHSIQKKEDKGPKWPAKAPSPASDSSSSSESEDDQIKKQGQLTGVAITKSPTVGNDPKMQWPLLDLEHTTSIKRRLDFKAKSQISNSSSSSDSEDKTTKSIKTKEQEQLHVAKLPLKESHNVETQSPTFAPTPHSDSSSSSDSENETANNSKKPEPLVEVSQTNWPLLDLRHTSSIKRRLDFKAQSPKLESSSSSDSEDETSRKQRVHLSKSPMLEPNSRLPGLALSSAPKVKSGQDIQGQISPSKSSSSSSESEGEATDMHVKVKRERTTLPELNTTIPLFKPHFNAKAPSQPEESSSSSSESDAKTKDHTAISKTREEEFIKTPTSPVMEVPLSPKTDPYIKLEKYNIMTSNFEQKSGESISTTPAINPELESRWATMSLGVSRFRKRLEITSHAQTPKLPSSSPPDSPTSSSSSESGKEGESRTTRKRREVRGSVKADSSPKAEITPATVSLSFKGQVGPKKEAGTRETSSSSDSENDTIDHSVPDLSLGVPRIKRRLNIKAPLPDRRGSLSSSSDAEEREYTVTQSRQISTMSQQRDTDTLITYKRSIFQATSPPGSPPPVSDLTIYETKLRYSGTAHQGPSYSVGDSTTSSKRSLSRSFDNLLNKMVGHPKHSTELPPELKWTGLGRQMSEPPISSPRRRLDVSSPPAEPELPPPKSLSSSSSSESEDETKQDKEKSNMTTQKYSFRASSMSTTRTVGSVDRTSLSTNEILRSLSEDKRERRGLSALKTMSSERQQWDVRDKTLGISTSHLLDDSSPNDEIDYHYQRSTRTQVYLSSTPVEEKRVTDLSYGVPSYRRHGFEVDEPPQETPPPVPATTPPSDEALGLTWRSRPNSWKERSEGTRSYWRQSLNTGGSGPSSPILDSSMNPISKV
ncbi:serine-rich adhesin for platelets [Cheilinus undulatus]|uniref:serine-rich adhesin for platelets n=1 Tax=Cheilinus undulatus TaxID=241271 RepID=UPI001BD65B29|nr:serine-rich adhesin for platelets [Cheilinus undulatus]